MVPPRSYVVDLLRLAGPVALARLGIIGMGIADVIVVGQLAPDELPHQALGWAPTGVFLVTGIGLLQGVQVLAARVIGAGKPETAGAVFWRGVMLALLTGVLAAVLVYMAGEKVFTSFGIPEELAAPSAAVAKVLVWSVPMHLANVAASFFVEAIKRPAISTVIMWLANGVNLALNLLWVPQHGAIGSAWATFGARTFLALALILWVLASKHTKPYFARDAGANKGLGYGALLAIGIAAAVSQAAEAGAFSAMTFIAGRIGANAVAAYQIMLNIMAFVFMIALGLAAAVAVLVSEAVGRKALGDAARAGWTGIMLLFIGMIGIAGLLLFFAMPIGHVYTADLTLAAEISALMWIAAMVLAPDGAQVVTASALRAHGDNWFPTFSHIVAYAIVMPLLGYWFAERIGLGVSGLLFAICLASVVSAGILIARWAVVSRRA